MAYTPPNNNLRFIDKKTDLPTAVSGVITLVDNVTYHFTTTVDLLGDRLVCGQNTVILGSSSENCRIKSTGLVGTALITSVYSLPIRAITIEANVALNLDGGANQANVALDWFGVNFTDCATVGTISNYSNFIMMDSSFLNSGGLTFNGTIGTIGITQCLLNGNTGNTALILPSSLIITRRIRISYSSFVILSGETGINFNTGTTIPVEGYLMDTVNFTGGGTYTSGVDYSDNKSKWKNCVGVINSVTLANMYMVSNTTPTNVLVTNDRYPMSGVTQLNELVQRFTHQVADNTLTYTSPIPRVFTIQLSFSFLGATNAICGFYIAINRGGAINPTTDRIVESEIYVTASGTRPDSGMVQTLTTLSQNDRVYFVVQNSTSNADITIEFMNMIVQVSPQD